MKRSTLTYLAVLLSGLALAQQPPPAPADAKVAANPKLKGYDPEGGSGKRLFVVPIDGTIELGLAAFVERALAEATKDDIVLLKVKTFGGRVDAAVRIRDALLDSEATTVAYVDRRAISAGALITLAAHTVIMSPGASIGAATPVTQGEGGEMKATSEKVVSYMRAEMRATAEARGRRADLAEAMVDADIEIKGVIAKDKLLTLTSDKALELGLADAIADGEPGVVGLLNIDGAERVNQEADWGEKLARLLTDPVVSPLLMTFGFLGLLLEFYSPGFGIGGAIGVTCLGLFFFGQYAANLAGLEEMLIFVLGLVLLLVEVLVIPGFGVAGIAGLALIGTSLVMAMIELELPWDVAFELGYAQEAIGGALSQIAVTLVVVLLAGLVFARFFKATPFARWLVVSSATTVEEGYVSEPQAWTALKGKLGKAETPLRPAGIATIDGQRVDVMSQGGFIDSGAAVEVLEVDGNRIVVRRAE